MLVLWGTTTAASAANVTRIDVYPPDVNLNTKLDLQRFIVVATRDDGVTLDVTTAAAVKLGRRRAGPPGRTDAVSRRRRRHDAGGRVPGTQSLGHGRP